MTDSFSISRLGCLPSASPIDSASVPRISTRLIESIAEIGFEVEVDAQGFLRVAGPLADEVEQSGEKRLAVGAVRASRGCRFCGRGGSCLPFVSGGRGGRGPWRERWPLVDGAGGAASRCAPVPGRRVGSPAAGERATRCRSHSR